MVWHPVCVSACVCVCKHACAEMFECNSKGRCCRAQYPTTTNFKTFIFHDFSLRPLKTSSLYIPPLLPPVFCVPILPEGERDLQHQWQHWAIPLWYQNGHFFRPSGLSCGSICSWSEEVPPGGGDACTYSLLKPSKGPLGKPICFRPERWGLAAFLRPSSSPPPTWAASLLPAPAQQPILLPYSNCYLLLFILAKHPDSIPISLLSHLWFLCLLLWSSQAQQAQQVQGWWQQACEKGPLPWQQVMNRRRIRTLDTVLNHNHHIMNHKDELAALWNNILYIPVLIRFFNFSFLVFSASFYCTVYHSVNGVTVFFMDKCPTLIQYLRSTAVLPQSPSVTFPDRECTNRPPLPPATCYKLMWSGCICWQHHSHIHTLSGLLVA